MIYVLPPKFNFPFDDFFKFTNHMNWQNVKMLQNREFKLALLKDVSDIEIERFDRKVENFFRIIRSQMSHQKLGDSKYSRLIRYLCTKR